MQGSTQTAVQLSLLLDKRVGTDAPTTSWPTSTDPGASIGPTEAINGRLEHLCGSAFAFRNLTHYIRPLPPQGRWIQPPATPRLRPALG
jgi:hypothetical protein